MWHYAAILVGGYAFIFFVYAWAMTFACAFSKPQSAKWLTKANVKALLALMAMWTVACAVMLVTETIRQ